MGNMGSMVSICAEFNVFSATYSEKLGVADR